MKVQIFGNELTRELRKKGRKTRSHGTYRAARKPNSPRNREYVRTNPQYSVR
jgi:hypothetical protein